MPWELLLSFLHAPAEFYKKHRAQLHFKARAFSAQTFFELWTILQVIYKASMKLLAAMISLGFLAAAVVPADACDCAACVEEHCVPCIGPCLDPLDPACWLCLVAQCAQCIGCCIDSLEIKSPSGGTDVYVKLPPATQTPPGRKCTWSEQRKWYTKTEL